MNNTMNATEIMFSAPTIIRPSAAVMTSPTNSVMNTAAIMRPERSASHRMTSTTMKVPMPLSTAPSFTDANSSSASGCSPVRRIVAP